MFFSTISIGMSLVKDTHRRSIGGLDTLVVPGNPGNQTIVLLHGYGADAEDLLLLSQIDHRPTWLFPQGPLSISFSHGYPGHAWFPINIEFLYQATQEGRYQDIAHAFSPELKGARESLEQFLSALSTPPLFLGGFSQGAILSLDTAFHAPSKVGGLLIFSGTLIHETIWRELAPHCSGIPFFQSHGTQDPLLPLVAAQNLEKLLQKSGLKGELHTFDGGHTIPPIILNQLSIFLNDYRVIST